MRSPICSTSTRHTRSTSKETPTTYPIQSSQFPSNWELSTARASTVVRFLIGHGVSPARLTATGNADQHPQASNESAAGRAQNRRVEIVLKALTPSETNP